MNNVDICEFVDAYLRTYVIFGRSFIQVLSGVNGCHTLGDERKSVPKDTESRGVRNGEGSPSPGKGYPPPALPQPTICVWGRIVSSISYSDIKVMQLCVA